MNSSPSHDNVCGFDIMRRHNFVQLVARSTRSRYYCDKGKFLPREYKTAFFLGLHELSVAVNWPKPESYTHPFLFLARSMGKNEIGIRNNTT
jgi:hypothetical protein